MAQENSQEVTKYPMKREYISFILGCILFSQIAIMLILILILNKLGI